MTHAPLPRAVLFDLDGTLIDTWRLYGESYQRALEPFLGRRLTEEEVAGLRPTSEREFLRGLLGPERGDACHAAFRRHYAELHGALSDGVYPGVREMLAALRSAGYPLGIVTGKGRRGWEVTEREIGLGPFAVVVTEDESEAAKPDPRGLLAAAREMGLAPADLVYVGDSAVDVAAGRAAGMRTAAVLWPKTGEGEAERFVNRIAPLGPDWVFERPADLTRTLARWC